MLVAPETLSVNMAHVKNFGVLPSLIAADLYFWLSEKGKHLRWTTYQTWADWFGVSTDTVKRTQPVIKHLFTVKRTRRKLNGKLVLGANCYQLQKLDAARSNELKFRCMTESQSDPVQLFPVEFIKLSKAHTKGQRVPEFAWFLCRISYLVNESEKQTGIRRQVSIKSLKWLSEYCHTPARTLERFIKQADMEGLFAINTDKDLLIISEYAEKIMLRCFKQT